jgi:hypothetical protein
VVFCCFFLFFFVYCLLFLPLSTILIFDFEKCGIPPLYKIKHLFNRSLMIKKRGRRGRMVVRFLITYAISTYHH